MREGINRGRGDSGGESTSSRGEGRGNTHREGQEVESRWKKHGEKEGRGSELGMTPEEIQWALCRIDHEAFSRAEYALKRPRRRRDVKRWSRKS